MDFMTSNEPQMHVADPFAFLSRHEFIVLTTYRKDGTAVPTTVWFAYDQGKIYITTSRSAGKIKRVRNNGHVLMTPSGRTGNLLGEAEIAGLAHEVPAAERTYAHSVLEQKYGEAFRRIGPDTSERTYIVVESPSSVV
jgi:PPOX class probable F420-dependent enzyme